MEKSSKLSQFKERSPVCGRHSQACDKYKQDLDIGLSVLRTQQDDIYTGVLDGLADGAADRNCGDCDWNINR